METATIANNIEEKYSFEILDSVHSAAADGDINKLQEHAKRLDQILTPNGETPLYLAAERGYVKVLKEILGTCDSPVDHGHYDRTALHVVIIRNDIAEKLVLDDPDKQTWTPLSVVFKPHHNSLTGNYDINVLIAVLEGRGKAVVWHDRRNDAVSIDLEGG
ncbi:hypothetical protein Q3G72_021441 [Acer saccharum]|nr:hypothetical protein Q3G72_021441 [Acer saccharum]